MPIICPAFSSKKLIESVFFVWRDEIVPGIRVDRLCAPDRVKRRVDVRADVFSDDQSWL
jgi:hypothetical protein